MRGIWSMPTIWNSGRWPYRPRPLPDELLSSYLTRAAHGLGLKPITLLNAALGSRQSLLAQDLDNFANPLIVNRLLTATNLDRDAVFGMTLAAYEGRISTTFYPKGRKVWIMPVKIAANDRKRPGLQYCPECFRTDESPYLRRTWRLAFATCCTVHAVALHDRCPECETHLHIHRSAFIRYCYSCDADLASAPKIRVCEETVALQRSCEAALCDGWAMLNDRPVPSHLYLMVIRQIASLLANGPRATKLRAAVVASCGGEDRPFEKSTWRQPIEYHGVNERRRLMELVAYVMSDFPRRFVATCRTAKLSRSHIIKDMPYVPYAFDLVLREHLDRSPYYPTEVEVAAAAAYLRRTKGIATYRALKEMFGESRALLYRHMTYERVPSAPSWRRTRASEEAGGSAN